MELNCNCCDGIYNSIDVHFTSDCDNRCKHCIDTRFSGLGIKKPNISSIVTSVVNNAKGMDDILFLGGEPCLYLSELLSCIKQIKNKTNLKVYVTTAVPKICYTEYSKFIELLSIVDGINLSVQHYDELIADKIRRTVSLFNRQLFYKNLPFKDKIRINLNIVKPFLYKKEDLIACLSHYDSFGFNSIKLSEIQHGTSSFVSFESIFDVKLDAPYSNGCQTYINIQNIIPNFSTPLLLKRSCFICETTLKANIYDGIKLVAKFFSKPKNNYKVIYGDGTVKGGWV